MLCPAGRSAPAGCSRCLRRSAAASRAATSPGPWAAPGLVGDDHAHWQRLALHSARVLKVAACALSSCVLRSQFCGPRCPLAAFSGVMPGLTPENGRSQGFGRDVHPFRSARRCTGAAHARGLTRLGVRPARAAGHERGWRPSGKQACSAPCTGHAHGRGHRCSPYLPARPGPRRPARARCPAGSCSQDMAADRGDGWVLGERRAGRVR